MTEPRILPNGELEGTLPTEVGKALKYIAATANEFWQLRQLLTIDGRLTRANRSRFSELRRERAKAEKVRDRFTAKMERKAEREREQAQRARDRSTRLARERIRKLAERLEAASSRKAAAAILPEKSKPTQAASKDAHDPRFQGGWVVKHGRGDTARWFLGVTDKYQAVLIPLTVTNPTAIRPVYLPPEALAAVEKAGAFRVTKAGAIQPLKVERLYDHAANDRLRAECRKAGIDDLHARTAWKDAATAVGSAYLPSERPKGPKFDQYVPKPPAKQGRLEIVVNPELLVKVAKAGGRNGAPTKVRLVLDTRKAEKGPRGRYIEQAIRVETGDNGSAMEGVVAPIRNDA